MIPGDFEREEIYRIADFGELYIYMKERQQDFHESIVGITVYFTEEMADEYIEKYLSPCVEEIRAIRSGKKFLKTKDYKWEV